MLQWEPWHKVRSDSVPFEGRSVKSFRVTDGDLDISHSKKVSLVRGRDKLVQDLTIWLLTPLGSAFLAPAFGSLLNTYSERDDAGRLQGAFIGQDFNQRMLAETEAEVDRILNLYQQNQIEKIRQARIDGTLYLFSKSEVLDSIDSVQSAQDFDRAQVRAFIRTGANSEFNLLAQVDTEETNISAS